MRRRGIRSSVIGDLQQAVFHSDMLSLLPGEPEVLDAGTIDPGVPVDLGVLSVDLGVLNIGDASDEYAEKYDSGLA